MPERLLQMIVSGRGVDWIAFVLMFASIHLLARHRRAGFLVAAGACAAWVVFNLMVDSLAGILGNTILAATNAIAWWKWTPRGPGGDAPAAPAAGGDARA